IRGGASPGAWLYALQAAKTSITVYGIWLGHVYHWHIVTAALIMTAQQTLPDGHPVGDFLKPQSDFVIAFDNVLLALWDQVAPPTSVTSALQFIRLSNDFAKGRQFFDDDPTTTLERLGVSAADFSVREPWDAYPIAGRLLAVWATADDYASSFVEATYTDDAAVANDAALQQWIAASGDPDGGNVRGLPRMDSREALTRVLTSFIYRVTAHGMSRLPPAANPGLTFVANYPPTLQNADIPSPDAAIDTPELLRFLPYTGTIGQMVTFYFTFSFSAPYVPLLPIDGINTDLYFGDDPGTPQNAALLRFRQGVLARYEEYAGPNPPRAQWPRNIET
ncbi:MAG: lipoxygenase family protein, partial [Acidobacteriota bacterium]